MKSWDSLDTGAHVFMVPEELVMESQMTGNAVVVRSICGRRTSRITAKVHLTVGEHSFSIAAATCPGKKLGCMALLVIDVCSPSELSLFVNLAGQIKARVKIPCYQIRRRVVVVC